MSALHIMTFNVQMLPWIAQAVFQGQTNDAEERADRVANDLFALPPRERPDVIIFNEVFDEDGRDRLLKQLTGTWPHVIKKLHDGGLEEDSGLMLFSRFPFLPLPTGGVLFERFYGDSADDDAKASKGVGIVQIDAPVSQTTIAFTHLQSSYASEDQYRDIRVRQLDTIHHAVDQVFAGQVGPWGTVIVIGDLNVRGDPGATSNEWASIFEPLPGAQSSTRLGGPLLDGWRTYMHPPGMSNGSDPGFTNIDFASGEMRRLDYQCFARRELFDRVLVPHHMFVRLRNASDHFALEAIVQQPSAHCTPSDAIDFLSLPSTGGPGTSSSMRFSNVDFVHQGSYQWLFVKEPGTYTVYKSPHVEVRLFAQSDLSHPLERLDTLATQQLPPYLQAAFDRRTTVDPRGETFVSRTPFFIAARHVKRDLGAGVVSLLTHRGETSATAIWLSAHRKVESSFPLGQKLGNDDICWFKAKMPSTFSGVPRPERFAVQNSTGGQIEITLRDAAEQPIGKNSGVHSQLELAHQAVGEELIFRIRSPRQEIAGVKVRAPKC